MSEVEELVERLRDMASAWKRWGADGLFMGKPHSDIAIDAADTIESLRASLRRVEEESSERMRAACLAVIESERLQECTGEEGDVAYETALDIIERGIKTICLSRASPTETERSG